MRPAGNYSIVEVLHDNCWSTLCPSSTWEDSEARVVCRQLGFSSGTISSSTVSPEYLQQRTDVAGGTVRCSGYEDNLAFCVTFLKDKNTCGQPALVECAGMLGKRRLSTTINEVMCLLECWVSVAQWSSGLVLSPKDHGFGQFLRLTQRF